MVFKGTKYFVIIVVLVVGGTRYMNNNMKRINMNNDIGVWDSEAKDGLRYTVITRSNDTGGASFTVHAYLTPKALGFYPDKPGSRPMHIHNIQHEEFEAISGVMMMSVNGTELQLKVGEKILVPAGVPHTFWNGGSEPCEFVFKLKPGVPDEGFLETVAGLSHQFGGLGQLNPIQLFLLYAENEVRLVDVPPPIWAAAQKILVPLAKLMGFRSRYPEYSSRVGQPLPVQWPPAEASEPAKVAEASEPAKAAEASEPAKAAEAGDSPPEQAAGAGVVGGDGDGAAAWAGVEGGDDVTEAASGDGDAAGDVAAEL